MPGFDRTGPMGQGPMTGGARGRCNPRAADYGSQSAGGFGYGRGQGFRGGFGRGMGRGYGSGYGPSYPLETADETAMLKSESDSLKRSLEAINRRLEALEKKNL